MAISQTAISNNLLIGTSASDYIAGTENTDTILGAESEDILIANEEIELINGNQGRDTIRGNESDEILRGGQNNDFITASNGNDTLLGDLGSDTLIGAEDDDIIFGAPFEDVDIPGDGKDALYGAQGNDTLFGGADDDLVFGNEDSDILYGNTSNDTIYGGQGEDTIFGGQENDQLFGDKDNDVLWGDLGVDSLTGGTGDDVFVIGRRNDVAGFLSTGGSTIAEATYITDFGDGLDLIALTGGLTFDDLNIFQGSGENVGNTVIQDKSTGEFLANLQGIDFTNLTKADFTYSTVRINNYLSFDRQNYSITEDGTPELNVTINRTGSIDEAVSATLFATEGTATATTDYDNTPILVNFAPGETSQTVAIPIVSDDIGEGEETFDLSLGFPFNGATVESPQTTTVTITDNGDSVEAADAGTIEFGSPTFAVNEDGTPIASVTINRTGGSSGPVSTKVLLNGGTAIGGTAPLAAPVDYDNSFITVEWEDGDTSPKTIDIPLTNDTEIEGTETINLTLCDCTGGATVGQQSTAVLNILDDEGSPSTTLNPEIDLFVGGTGIPDDTGKVDFGTVNVGDDLTKTFTIENTSPTDTLNINGWELPDGYCLEGIIPGIVNPNSKANFTIAVDTAKAGNFDGVISLLTNDRDESPFNFAVNAAIGDDTTPTPTENEIQLFDGGTEINDGSTSAIDFGTVNIGETLNKTFTIKNPSNEALNLSDFTLPEGFTIEGEVPDTITPNSEETFTLKFDTSKATNTEGTFSFVTENNQNNPFDFVIKAAVNEESAPTENEIQIFDGGTEINDGSTSAIDFGTVNIGETLNKTFTIKNPSNEALNLSDFTLPEGFTIEGEVPDTITPNSEETFTLKFDTSKATNTEGTFSFVTENNQNNPFDFVIKAAVNETETPIDTGADIQVLDEGIYNLPDGEVIPVDFGTAHVGKTLNKTFSIRNTSSEETLNITNVTLPKGFSFEEELPDNLPPNSEQSFTINVDTSTAGTYEGDIIFETNDSDENPFNFVIKGTVNEESEIQEGGEVQIFDGGTEINDGSTNLLDFGIVNIEESLSKTFTVKNSSSSETLVLSNLTLPEGFSLEGEFPETVAPNSEANFTIKVDTTQITNWEGTFSFDTSDPDRNPFDFMIGASISDPSAPVEIFGSNGRDRIQGDDDGVDIITPGGGADIITWKNVPPQGITDEIIGFVPNEDKLQFAVANFGNISSITPVTVTDLSAEGTNISGNNLIIFDQSVSFADRNEVDLALAQQNGTSNFPAFFVYSANGEQYLGYDPIVNNAGDATNIAKLDVAPTAESFSFFN
ncbi:hypothetical protein NIES2119_10505 [[Phormidium ambiguum] IAM M-71]|uniref:Calx-beta domain-containing protein n=1 Tax=[Phormidium ambiguum] IAM M-71 TaxID=454136 RepID=A0A1U7IMK1_9CYAN|nr:choice-of-anchor D domain-containing protein [Phormidium ambiguum]OKH38450.1 hypothetical protein NIES2119_10505 [Phormidium ambiguum IAM M-71]